MPNILLDFFSFRIVGNRPHRRDIVLPLPGVSGSALLVLEFDDQGLLFDERGIDVLEAHLDALAERNPVIVVFVHGWKHDASAGDAFLDRIQALIADAARSAERPILAVILAWRGLSRAGNWVWQNSSFWDRQSAAERVAVGTPREILGRLKMFRAPPGQNPRATLLVVGHSFGALIVYTAIAQSLIDAALAGEPVVPSFGDLVLLINPAFSAISYLPMFSIIERRVFADDQLPVFVSITAANDQATGLLYPLGNLLRPVTEAWRTRRERQALTQTMGHLPWLLTHTLSVAPGPVGSDPATALRALCQRDVIETIGGVLVTRAAQAPGGPFWVASATPDIIDGHDGIFLPAFEGFVRALLQAHAATKKTVTAMSRPSPDERSGLDM